MFMDPRVMLEACNLQVTDVVADFGAGSGFVSRAAAALIPKGTVFAIELQRDMVTRIARDAEESHIKNLNVIWGDIEIDHGSSLKEDSVDFVIMANVLFQLDDKNGAFQEAYRVLKSGGRLFVADWQESFGGLGPTPASVFTSDMAKTVAIKIGFTTMVDTLPAGDHHYGILFKK